MPTGVSDMLIFFKSIDNTEFDQQVVQAAQMIIQGERIFLIGAGTSGSLGKYGARYFSSIGKFSHHIDDPYYPYQEKPRRPCISPASVLCITVKSSR